MFSEVCNQISTCGEDYFMKHKFIKMPMLLVILAISFTSTVLAKTNIENYLVGVDIKNSVSGINKVDCVYVINLEHRSQKWIETRDVFNFYGIHPNRVTAINGWTLSKEDQQVLCGNYSLRLRGGQIGCILSHLSTLQDAFRRGYRVIWVCEDDIQICENPHQLNDLISTLSEIDPEWDILYTDRDSRNRSGEIVLSVTSDFRPDFPHKNLNYYIRREVVNKDLIKINQRFGAYSLILSKRGVEKILRHFIDNYLWTAYDIDIHYTPEIRQYCISRDLVSVNWKQPSDTECNIE